MNDEQFVGARLGVLESALDNMRGDWRPDTEAAWRGLARRARRRRVFERGTLYTAGVLSAVVLLMLALPAPASCALVRVGCPRIAPALAAATRNYKESGSPSAAVVVEIYSDYECPHCALFFTGVYPRFEAEFVKTGKVRVIHRDFPLPMHPHAKIAARYANAAGETGNYDAVVMQLFRLQSEWAANGNIDAVVAEVLPPGVMRQVRQMVASDAALERTVETDMRAGVADGLKATPSLVIVLKGKRQKIDGAPGYEVLRAYLNQLLGNR